MARALLPLSDVAQTSSRPRVLLLDFGAEDAQAVAETGHDVACGRSGFAGGHRRFPVAPTEVDLLFWDASEINTAEDGEGDGHKVAPDCRTHRARTVDYPQYVYHRGGCVVVFLGSAHITPFILHSITGIRLKLAPAPGDPGQLRVPRTAHPLAPLLARTLERTRAGVQIEANGLPGAVTLLEDEGERIYALQSAPLPEKCAAGGLILLPAMPPHGEIVRLLLREYLPAICPPDLFPAARDAVWLQKERYRYPGTLSLLQELDTLEADYRTRRANLERQLAEAQDAGRYLEQLLTADDSDALDPPMRLSHAVARALESLGFETTPVESAGRRRAGQGEAVRLRDRQSRFAAVAQIWASLHDPEEAWLDVLVKTLRRHTLAATPPAPEAKGLLIVNYQRRIDPEERSPLSAAAPDLVTEATTLDVGILPTPTLFDLCRARHTGQLSEEEVRSRLTRPGLISLDAA